MSQLPQEITEAIRLYKENRCEESRLSIQNYLVNKTNAFDALLWLAKVSGNPQEALNAAELACNLKPDSEIAQRAIATISSQNPDNDTRAIELNLIKLTGLTESQARAVNWPFRGLNRPIGVLMDEKCIELRDIAWAAENAYDPVLQKAAQTLLLSSIFQNKVKETPKPITIIEGRDNAGYHERLASLKAGLYMGIMVTITFLVIALPIANRFFNFIDNTALNVIGYLGLLIVFLILNPASQSSEEVVNYRVGREGERKVLDLLRASLYTPWILIHNFEWPNRKWGDADIVLAGPGGIWCFEVKSYSNQVRNVGGKWQYRSRFGWRNMSKNPTKQVQRTAMQIKDYLENSGIRIRWVQPVIIWAGDEKNLSLEDPLVPVWKLSDIGNKVEDFWCQQKFNDDQLSQVSTVLRAAIEKVKQ